MNYYNTKIETYQAHDEPKVEALLDTSEKIYIFADCLDHNQDLPKLDQVFGILDY